MCGRFTLAGDLDFYADYFGAIPAAPESLTPSWNVAPTDSVYVIAEREGTRQVETMRWGLIPSFASDAKTIHINARQETVATSPAFRLALRRRRCLVPADGFYEWEGGERSRVPHFIFRADGYPVGFAGVWETRSIEPAGTLLRTCAIITTPATGVVASLHDRMPVALPSHAWDEWLNRELTNPLQALDQLHPIDDDLWTERPVSPLVNSVRNNGPELLDPDPQGRLL